MDTREAEQIKVVPPTPNGRSSEPAMQIDEPKAGPRRRYIFGGIGAVLAVLLLIWGVNYYLYARVHEGTDDARVDADAVAITSKINERIDDIPVATNQQVKKGQTLVVLDKSVEEDQLRTAQAQYDLALANQRNNTTQSAGGVTQAQASEADASAGVALANAQLSAAQAQVPAAQAAYDRAAADYNRTASLVASGDVARAQLDAARATQAAAAAALRGAQDQVGVARASLNAADSRVNAAAGGVASAQGKLAQSSDPSGVEGANAQLSIAKQNLGYTTIVAPIDGYIGQKSADIGQTVGAGLTLMTLIPNGPDKVFITANFKETQLGDMHSGQPVDITVDAYKGVTFHGHVVSINPASQNTYALVPAQNATGNFVKVTQRIPVRIAIDDMKADMPLRPGMSVEANVKVR
jgi:membrane fusion protein (multidrug efflux system)